MPVKNGRWISPRAYLAEEQAAKAIRVAAEPEPVPEAPKPKRPKRSSRAAAAALTKATGRTVKLED